MDILDLWERGLDIMLGAQLDKDKLAAAGGNYQGMLQRYVGSGSAAVNGAALEQSWMSPAGGGSGGFVGGGQALRVTVDPITITLKQPDGTHQSITVHPRARFNTQQAVYALETVHQRSKGRFGRIVPAR